ncbi:MAG: Abi family protein [Candidatus Acidiferrales bacterium]
MADNQVKNDGYSDGQIKAIERSLSTDRFNSYLIHAKGDKNKAIRLYEYNTEVSEALFGVVQGLEVTLRNSMHRILQKQIGAENWYEKIPLQEPESESLQEARKTIDDLNKTVTASRLIARLSFGFWVRLTASIYEKDLWVPHLYRAFPMRMVRSLLYKRLFNIKELRNQIAHHERIIRRDIETDYKELLETIKWLCPTTCDWVKNTARFEKIKKP